MTAINRHRLFWLSVLALFTASMSASLRAAVASSLKAEWIDPIAPIAAGEMIGAALGSAFLGFSITVFVVSAFLDTLGIRRVLIGWIGGGSVASQSLARDLTLSAEYELLQQFSPELQMLRMPATRTSHSFDGDDAASVARVRVAGSLQLEVVATFSWTAASLAANGGTATQALALTNSLQGKKKVLMKLRITYKRGGSPVQVMAQVGGFPDAI